MTRENNFSKKIDVYYYPLNGKNHPIKKTGHSHNFKEGLLQSKDALYFLSKNDNETKSTIIGWITNNLEEAHENAVEKDNCSPTIIQDREDSRVYYVSTDGFKRDNQKINKYTTYILSFELLNYCLDVIKQEDSSNTISVSCCKEIAKIMQSPKNIRVQAYIKNLVIDYQLDQEIKNALISGDGSSLTVESMEHIKNILQVLYAITHALKNPCSKKSVELSRAVELAKSEKKVASIELTQLKELSKSGDSKSIKLAQLAKKTKSPETARAAKIEKKLEHAKELRLENSIKSKSRQVTTFTKLIKSEKVTELQELKKLEGSIELEDSQKAAEILKEKVLPKFKSLKMKKNKHSKFVYICKTE